MFVFVFVVLGGKEWKRVVLHNHTAEDAFDCLAELIKIMTYDVENGGMREAGLKQLEYIRQEYSKLEEKTVV